MKHPEGPLRAGASGTEPAFQQGAALCWRKRADKLQVILVTSRDTGRWVLPKGWPHPGLSPAEGAAREAWEEAGVHGICLPLAIGDFTYVKRMDPEPDRLCLVRVFALRVTGLDGRYPERRMRQRKWFTLEDAAGRVDEPGLSALIRRFRPTDLAGPHAAEGAAPRPL